jgi:TnpA family transposase
VNEQTNFLSGFTHILYKDAKTTPEAFQLIGAIIAYATNMGLSKMASCSNITYTMMKSTRDSFFREDTLKLVNDILINATANLPIHELYKIGGTIHSAVDGKKYDALGHIFNARYSPKYFNMGKGISVLTLMINFLPAAIKLISPNEYEGNFGLELLMMNETNLQSVINSTDMHGINDLNFALYDGTGYDFQPRYTNLYDAAKNIVSSSQFTGHSNDVIRPASTVDDGLIVDEEDNFKRVVVSILSKTCSVSTIVKKLSSSLKSHKTRKAISEYNKILRSIHILKSINETHYRQNIQKALNRIELYHFLTGEVGYANRGKIIAKTELDQIIFKECTRLVCNVILYYNSVILSQIYTNLLESGRHSQIEILKHVSPVSWVNISLYGIFELRNKFNTSFPDTELDDLKETLFKNDIDTLA